MANLKPQFPPGPVQYIVEPSPAPYSAAESHCRGLGMDVVSVDNLEQYWYIQNLYM